MRKTTTRAPGTLALNWPKSFLIGILIATAFFVMGLTRLELRTDGASLYPIGDATVLQTEADRLTFREPERVVLLLRSRVGGAEIASKLGLQTIRDLHSKVATLDGVDAERVRSLATVMDPAPGLSIVQIPNMLDTIPSSEEKLQQFLKRVDDSPHGRGLFLSEDGRAGALYVPLLTGQDHSAFLTRIMSWIDTNTPPEFELNITGPIVAETTLGAVVLQDLMKLVPLVVLVIAILLLVALRSFGALCAAMAEVGIVLIWTLGAMGWANVPVTLMTTILPIVLLTMAITDEVHLLDRLRAHLAEGSPKREAMILALHDVARPMVLTSLTTAAGLLSFTQTSIQPLRHFGIFAATGVLLALVLSFTLVPALVCVLPARYFTPLFKRATKTRLQSASLAGVPSAKAALVGVALLLIASPGVLLVEARDSWIDNLEEDSELVLATHAFDDSFWGSYRYDVVLSAEELAFFQFPTGLGVVERVAGILRHGPHVEGIISHLDAHEVHALVDGESLPVSALPFETVRRFSGDLMKIQARVDLANYLTGDGRSARIRMLIPRANFARTQELEDYVERELPRVLEGTGVRFHRSGDLASAQAAVSAVVGNVVRSTGWSICAVLLILIVALRSFRMALVCILPLVSGVIMLLACMGWLGVPLGIATGMVTALTIGVGVDFSLHMTHAYARARQRGEDRRAALETMSTRASRAVVWNTIVLATGLSVLGFSTLPPNRSLGLLLAGSMILSCTLCLLFLPRLLLGKTATD